MASVAIASPSRESLLADYRRVRQGSIAMCRPLDAEMFRIQTMDDVSPPWWNLGHTSWFFVRKRASSPSAGVRSGRRGPGRRAELVLCVAGTPAGPLAAGTVHPADHRGNLRLPRMVDRRLEELLARWRTTGSKNWPSCSPRGLNHEQQHQELFYTEIKHILAQNPRACGGRIRRRRRSGGAAGPAPALHKGTVPFSSNENRDSPPPDSFADLCRLRRRSAGVRPSRGGLVLGQRVARAPLLLDPFALADRLVTNAEYHGVHRGRRLSPAAVVARQRLELRGSSTAGGRRCIGKKATGRGRSGRWAACAPLEPTSRSATLASTRPTPLPLEIARRFANCRGVRLPSEREWEHAARQRAWKPPARPSSTPAGCIRLAPTKAGRWATSAARLAMDQQLLRAVSGLQAVSRRAGGVQRQIHGQPAGASRRLVRDAARSLPHQLPQLLGGPDAVSVHRHPAGPRFRRLRATR